MFTLKNEVGNVIRKVKTARERDRWVEDGYTDITEEIAAKKAEEERKAAEAAKKDGKDDKKQGDAK